MAGNPGLPDRVEPYHLGREYECGRGYTGDGNRRARCTGPSTASPQRGLGIRRGGGRGCGVARVRVAGPASVSWRELRWSVLTSSRLFRGPDAGVGRVRRGTPVALAGVGRCPRPRHG
jgi:hypothetical protein